MQDHDNLEHLLTLPPVVDRQFITEHIHQLLAESREEPDLSWFYPLLRTAIVETALIHTRGNQRKAGELLGIHRFTVRTHYHAYSKWIGRQKG